MTYRQNGDDRSVQDKLERSLSSCHGPLQKFPRGSIYQGISALSKDVGITKTYKSLILVPVLNINYGLPLLSLTLKGRCFMSCQISGSSILRPINRLVSKTVWVLRGIINTIWKSQMDRNGRDWRLWSYSRSSLMRLTHDSVIRWHW